jgi:hypothetical protein
VSNDRGAGPQGAHLASRIGETVYLVAGPSAGDFDFDFGDVVLRHIELVAADRPFVAFQLSVDIDSRLEATEWELLDLDGFAAAAKLDATELGELIALIFRLVASSFALRRDPVLNNVFQALLAMDGMPRGKVVVHAIEGIETAIFEVPTRLRLADAGLIIGFGDQVALGAVESVEEILGEDGGRRLAAVDCSSQFQEGRALVLTARGLASADIALRSHADMRAFNEQCSLELPDALNLLAIHDIDARTALAAIGRRETAQPSVSIQSLGFSLEITQAYSMPHGLFVSGWLCDPDKVLEDVLVIDHGLSDPSLSAQWITAPAKTMIAGEAVAVSQFHAFLPRGENVAAPASVAFRLQMENGENHIAYVPDCCRDRRDTRKGILDTIAGRAMPPDLMMQVFAPAIAPIQQACNEDQGVREVIDIGVASSRRVSLIIPLYRETRFMRSQLIAFNIDPYMRQHCQIVYVVDDPLIAQRVRNMLECSVNVFSLDIRLVILERNGGYALANNFGVQEASGEFVVLMNSDIAPETPGWLEPMIERLLQLPSHSIIGPKLLYADGSLQHAGMYFFKLPSIGYWQIGDYEDSDLCLKLRAAGGTCLYMPSVALLHFERQSMPDSEIDAGSTIYNRALHSARWSETIEALMHDVSEVRHRV